MLLNPTTDIEEVHTETKRLDTEMEALFNDDEDKQSDSPTQIYMRKRERARKSISDLAYVDY